MKLLTNSQIADIAKKAYMLYSNARMMNILLSLDDNGNLIEKLRLETSELICEIIAITKRKK